MFAIVLISIHFYKDELPKNLRKCHA